MKFKIIVFLSFFVLSSVYIKAKSDATLICRFLVDIQELQGHLKIFVNNSKYDLVIRWGVKDTKTGKFYRQEPILKRGDSITIDHEAALKYLDGAGEFEYSLELLRVRQSPKGAGHPLVTTRLKDGSLALALHKSKFLNNSTFAFSLNKNGLLVCKSS